MNRLSVVQLLPALQSGGVEKGALEVAEALVKAGHRSIVVSAGGQMVTQLMAQGSEHVNWNLGKKSPLTFLQAGKFRKWLFENQVDIVHARSRMPAWVAYLAWKKMSVETRPRFVTTVHGLNSVSAYSKIMTAGERVIAVSNTVKEYVLDNYEDIEESKLRVIPRGIAAEDFPFGFQPNERWRQKWFENYPQTESKRLLTLPGRLTRLKGHHDFITLIERLRQQVPNLHGLIVGGEDPKRLAYARELYQRVQEGGLGDDITFTGYRCDMREIYAISAAVLSLSSKPESFGRTVVEAISLGRPVVAYSHGGVGETLAKLFPAGLVEKGNIDSLAQTCLQLFKNEITPPSQAQTAYLKSDMLSQTLQLYKELAG